MKTDKIIRGMDEEVWSRALSYARISNKNIAEYIEDLITDDLDAKKYQKNGRNVK